MILNMKMLKNWNFSICELFLKFEFVNLKHLEYLTLKKIPPQNVEPVEQFKKVV